MTSSLEMRAMICAPSVWTEEDPSLSGGDFVDITSGGIQDFKPEAEPPCLYLSENEAIKAWFETCREWGLKTDRKKFRWVEKPTLDKWIMTAQHSSGSHRSVSTRFTVYSRIMVE